MGEAIITNRGIRRVGAAAFACLAAGAMAFTAAGTAHSSAACDGDIKSYQNVGGQWFSCSPALAMEIYYWDGTKQNVCVGKAVWRAPKPIKAARGTTTCAV